MHPPAVLITAGCQTARTSKEEGGLEGVTKITGCDKAPFPRQNLATLRPAIPGNTGLQIEIRIVQLSLKRLPVVLERVGMEGRVAGINISAGLQSTGGI